MIEDALAFFFALDARQMLFYFWPFFFFDFVRYVLLDLLILLVFLPGRRRRQADRLVARQALFHRRPLVSVVVPGKNEGRHLQRLASSLKKQTYSHLELIVVDDGSDDDTPSIGSRLQAEGLIDLFLRNEIRGGKASAANTALMCARGEYVIHLDADSHLANTAIEDLILPFLMDSRVGAVGGDIRVSNSNASIAARLQNIEYMKSLSTGRTVSSMLGILRIVSGACGAFRRDLLDRLGGWDVGPGLDGDITLKIRKLGYRIVHEPHAACYTHVPSSFRRLARQRYRWDRSMVRFRLRKHLDLFLPSQNFSWSNFFSSFENVFANLLLNLKWWAYLVQMLVFSPELMAYIFIINYMLYAVSNLVEYAVAVTLYGSTMTKREWYLLPFVPLMPFYTGIFLRAVRTFAQLMELVHRSSYRDGWNPWKVSRIAKSEKL